MKKQLLVVAASTLVGVVGCTKTADEAGKKAEAPAAEKKAEAAAKPAADKKAEAPAAEKKAEAAAKPAADKKAEAPAAEKKAEAAAKPATPPTGQAAKLVGEWKIDTAALLEANEEMKKQVEAKPEAKAMMEGMFAKMRVIFGADSLTMSGMGKDSTGTYKVEKTEGNAVTVTATKAGDTKSETFVLTFADDDHVTMGKPGDKMKLTLVRSK